MIVVTRETLSKDLSIEEVICHLSFLGETVSENNWLDISLFFYAWKWKIPIDN